MAVKSLENTFIYKNMNENGRITTKIMNILQHGTVLTRESVQEQLFIINKNFKYPMKYLVLEAFEKGDIQLIYAPSDEKLMPSLPFFLTKNKQGVIVAVISIDLYGTLNKSNFLTVDTKKLYTLMEAAYIAKLWYVYNNQIISKPAIISNGTVIYSNIVTRLFNKKYALNLDRAKLNKLIFLSSKFFCLNLLNISDTEMVYNYSLKNCIEPNTIQIKETDELFDSNGYEDIGNFITALEDKEIGFNFKDLSVRGFMEAFMQMYGTSILYALESFPYFMYNVLSVTNGAYLNNQYILEDVIGQAGAKMYVQILDIAKYARS